MTFNQSAVGFLPDKGGGVREEKRGIGCRHMYKMLSIWPRSRIVAADGEKKEKKKKKGGAEADGSPRCVSRGAPIHGRK